MTPRPLNFHFWQICFNRHFDNGPGVGFGWVLGPKKCLKKAICCSLHFSSPGGPRGGVACGAFSACNFVILCSSGWYFLPCEKLLFPERPRKSLTMAQLFLQNFRKLFFSQLADAPQRNPVEAHAHFFSALPSFPHLLSCLWLIVSYVAPGKPGLGFTDRTSTITLCDLSGPDKGFVGGSGGPSKAASSNLFKSISCLSRVIGLLSTAKDGASSSFLPYRCALQKRANMWHSLLWKHPRLFRFPICDFATLCSETFPVVQ